VVKLQFKAKSDELQIMHTIPKFSFTSRWKKQHGEKRLKHMNNPKVVEFEGI